MPNFEFEGGLTAAYEVSDVSKSIAWYQDVMGFTLQYHLDEMGWCEMASSVARVNVGLSQVENPKVEGGPTLTWGVKDIDAATFRDGLQTTDRVMDRIINLIASRLGLDHDRALGSRYSISLMSRCFIQRVERLATMPNGTGAFSGTFTFSSGIANLVRPRVG